jgi:hypothetical protein
MLDCGLKKLPSIAANILEEFITLEELRTAVATGKARKAPGFDGISHEFFKITVTHPIQSRHAVQYAKDAH